MSDAPALDDGAPSRLELAGQCRAVDLTSRGESLAEAAARLHCVSNDGSDERWETDQSYRERALMGYRGEVAVAEYYGLTPRIDYRPPTVGDAGHDYWVRFEGSSTTVDVKTTRTDPPRLYLTRKRAWSDRYTLPDAYLLVGADLTDDDRLHLVGLADSETVTSSGREKTVYGNPVWEMSAADLRAPPEPEEIQPLPDAERELRWACDRADLDHAEVLDQ